MMDNLCLTALKQMTDVEEARYVVLLMDQQYMSSILHDAHNSICSPGGQVFENVSKRRMSKNERKRLEKQRKNQTSSTSDNTSEVVNANKESESKSETNGTTSIEACDKIINTKEAAIVLHIQRERRYRTHYVVSILTKEDVCESYAASIAS